MARYRVFPEAAKTLEHVERLRRHQDHLKTLDDCYAMMRQEQTYDRMRDVQFRCDPEEMKQLDSSHFTSLIIRLSPDQGQEFFAGIQHAYEELKHLLVRHDPGAAVETYFDSAHVTVKSLEDGLQQNARALSSYLPMISPVVRKWVGLLGKDTSLYAVGLFTNLHAGKGLAVGVKFYPSLPLIQMIRGEVGIALYTGGSNLPLRSESSFHTMLTHSTGFRARNLSFPMSATFVSDFQSIVERYDGTLFGAIEEIEVGDFCVRNGYSDKMIAVAEAGDGDGLALRIAPITAVSFAGCCRFLLAICGC